MVDSSSEFKSQFDKAANSAAENAKSAYDDIKKAAGQMGEQAKEIGSKMMSQAKTYFNDQAEAATASVGSRLKAAGRSVREGVPQEGALGSVSNYTAQRLNAAGEYIENQGFDGMVQQVKTLVKENPLRTVFVAVAIGFVLARATTHRR